MYCIDKMDTVKVMQVEKVTYICMQKMYYMKLKICNIRYVGP